MGTIDSKKSASVVAKAASEKKALDVVTIDMRKLPNVADYFIIASGTSSTQVKAIADNIVKVMREDYGVRPWHVEGIREGLWVLVDYGDVVAHIFQGETRRFYNLEKLWAKAPQKKLDEKVKSSKSKIKAKKVSKIKSKKRPIAKKARSGKIKKKR